MFGVKSLPSVTENIWSALPSVCSTHQTSTLGCVQTLALFETLGCLGTALGGQTDRQTDRTAKGTWPIKMGIRTFVANGIFCLSKNNNLWCLFL